MDYQKINSRWIYGLTLSVFARNLITYLFIAALNVLFGVAQNFVPFMGIGSLLAAVYLGGVSFMVAHRTILSDETISPGDAFAFTTQNKTFFLAVFVRNRGAGCDRGAGRRGAGAG